MPNSTRILGQNPSVHHFFECGHHVSIILVESVHFHPHILGWTTTVQKLDVPGPDEKFCLFWLCAFIKFSSVGGIFLVHLIFKHL